MKILHIITGLATGGAERALYTLLSAGLAKRFDCAVMSLSTEGTIGAPIRALGVPVHTLEIRAGIPGPGAMVRLRRHVMAFRPDVIQGWMYHGNLAASFAAWSAPGRPRLAWNVRQSLYDLAKEKPLTRQVIRANRVLCHHPDAIVYNSNLSRIQHERFGIATKRGIVIPNGVDSTLLRPDLASGMEVRRELGIDPEALVVGHVARFHPMKDHAGFLRVAVDVAKQVAEARFLLIGRNVGPNNPALFGIIPPDLMPRFIFSGERRDVPRLMQAMDVLCSSSSWGEAFPNVLGEAMACGVPCVATDVGDSASIVGETGIIVPPSDGKALARALTNMLRKSPKSRAGLGHDAKQRINAHYSIEETVESYTKLYERMAGRTLSVPTQSAR